MMETLDHPVRMLIRIRIGSILLGDLKEGEVREIPSEEIEKMIQQCLYDKSHNSFLKEDFAYDSD